eukprot:Hpha_TRINITY_DN2303_c0_g1::TRINITY_DN2303_c0_g1_i1::g.456::m.456
MRPRGHGNPEAPTPTSPVIQRRKRFWRFRPSYFILVLLVAAGLLIVWPTGGSDGEIPPGKWRPTRLANEEAAAAVVPPHTRTARKEEAVRSWREARRRPSQLRRPGGSADAQPGLQGLGFGAGGLLRGSRGREPAVTVQPTAAPSEAPTAEPTEAPTALPTSPPTAPPTEEEWDR